VNVIITTERALATAPITKDGTTFAQNAVAKIVSS